MKLRAVVLTIGVFGVACGMMSDDKIPTPWSKREGQAEIVGSGPAEAPPEGQEEEPRRPSSFTTTQGPEIDADAPEVEDNYDDMALSGTITCPDGTELVDEFDGNGDRFCVLKTTKARHGPYAIWYPNGQVRDAGPYSQGMREGAWSHWSKDGKKETITHYSEGQPGKTEVLK